MSVQCNRNMQRTVHNVRCAVNTWQKRWMNVVDIGRMAGWEEDDDDDEEGDEDGQTEEGHQARWRFGQTGGRGRGCCRPSPALQCWTASPNHLLAVSEGGGARCWRQPRRVLGQREWEIEGESERGSQRVCSGALSSGTQPTAQPLHSSSLILFLSTLPLVVLLPTPLLLCLPPPPTISAFHFSSCTSTPLFTPHPSPYLLAHYLPPFSSWPMR